MGCLSCCGCCGRFLGLLLLPVLILVGVLKAVPGAEREYIRVVETHCTAIPLAKHLLYAVGQAAHLFDYGVPFVVPFWNPLIVHAYNGHQSPGLFPFAHLAHPHYGYSLARVSHESVRAIHYDPKARRDPDRFVAAVVSKTPKGYFAPGVQPTLLQMNTDDPERYAHRDLVVAVMPALSEQPPSVPAFAPAPDVTAGELLSEIRWHLAFPFPKVVPEKTQSLFAYTFFRHVFEVDLTAEELGLLKEWTTVNGRIFILGTEAGAKRSSELAAIFRARLAASAPGRRLLAEAARRGLDAEGHLNKLIFQFVFAGFGGDGPGGGLATLKLLKRIQSDPKHYVPLFKQDPAAFVLEALRVGGGGGAGMNPTLAPETKKYTLPTGVEVSEEAGDLLFTVALHANHDPAVFGGPTASEEYTTRFLPGRENADRLLTFVSEVRDIRRCPNMTGCDAAPRFCMGTFVLQRIMVQIATYYIDALEAESAPKGEL